MKVITFIVVIIGAIALALTLTLTPKSKENYGQEEEFKNPETASSNKTLMPSKRLSRFLAENEQKNRRTSHCKKDHQVCIDLLGKNFVCCNSKCKDLVNDRHNCGACKKKCSSHESCCGGKCVNLHLDKNNCGSCNNKCKSSGSCMHGMCDYA